MRKPYMSKRVVESMEVASRVVEERIKVLVENRGPRSRDVEDLRTALTFMRDTNRWYWEKSRADDRGRKLAELQQEGQRWDNG